MSIKTSELPQVESVLGTDAIVADTSDGTKRFPFSRASEFFKNELKPTMQAEAATQISARESIEKGNVTITNNQAYPFSSEGATVSLSVPRQNMDYVIHTEIASATGNVQAVEVYDKQLNGFKIRYDGSATSVTIKYYVSGGMQE